MLMFRETPGPSPAEGDAHPLSLHDLWGTAVRNKWLVALVTALVMAAAVLLTRMQTPVYVGAATLRIDDPRSGPRLISDMLPGGGAGRTIETEMLVLGSRQIAEAVVDSLALQVRVLEPERPRTAIFSQVVAPRTADRGVYTLEWDASRRAYRVSAEKRWDAGPLPHEARIGEPFTLSGVTLTLRPELRAAPPERLRLQVESFRGAVGGLQQSMTVSRVNRDAEIVSIRYESNDPELAAAVPNVAAASFVDYKTRAAKTESRSTVEFLTTQVSNYERELAGAELRLKSFRESARVVSPQEQASEQVKRLAEIQARRDELRVERESLGRTLAEARAAPTQEAAFQRYRELGSFPTFLGNPAVQSVLSSLTEMENQRTQILIRRQEAADEVQALNARIAALQNGLYRTAQAYLDGIDGQITSLDATLGRFGQELETIPAREIEYARLLRQQKLLEEIYTLLQTRLKEAEITEAVEPANVRVVDSALVPLQPSSPRPVRNLFFATVVGLFLGFGAAFAREALDTKVRTLEDAQQAAAGLPMLGTIPRIPVATAANGNGRKHAAVVKVAPESLLADSVITRRDPHSPVSEAYRALRTSVTFAGVERPPQLVVVTSAMPGDGKTTSASNLAITLAQQGIRTLLVDADLRRGLLHKLFDAREQPGLTNVLHMGMPLEQAVQQVATGEGGLPLDFLSSGPLPPNPAEILGSERMRALLTELRSRYDTVIFDAPPLNLVTDAAVLGKVVDTTVLVARANITDQRALRHAAAQLHFLHVPVAGLVLNDVDASASSYYGYGKYGYNGH